MKPPTRKRASRASRELQIEEYSRWSLPERQSLLKALEIYSVQQSSEIANVVQTKTEAEVVYYLSKLKRSLRYDSVTIGSSLKRKYLKNIEEWIRFAHQLVDDDEESYSSMIGKILALYGEHNFKKTDPITGVNFRAIYNYISGLLLGVQFPVLPPLESAIVVDLLKNVATFLSQSDIALHKKFILMNYEKLMFPGFTPSGSPEKVETVLERMLNKDRESPVASRSSSKHPLGKEIPSSYERTYTEEMSRDGAKVMVVRLKRIDDPGEISVSQVPSEAGLGAEKLPSREIVQPDKDCTGVLQVPKGDTDQPKTGSGCIEQLPNKGDVLHMPTVDTLFQFSNGGNVLQSPSRSTVQQGPDSFPQSPIGGTVSKRAILSSLLQDPLGGTVQQRTDTTNISQTTKKHSILTSLLQSGPLASTALQETSNAKVIQVTNKELGKQGSSDAGPHQVTSGSTVLPETSSSKVFQVTTSRAPSLSNPGSPHSTPVVKIVGEMLNVSVETQTPISIKQTPKRKLPIVKSEMASMGNKRRCGQLRNISDDSEVSGSDSEALKNPYEPSVSWLNPMNIPQSLINLTKTKQKRSSR